MERGSDEPIFDEEDLLYGRLKGHYACDNVFNSRLKLSKAFSSI